MDTQISWYSMYINILNKLVHNVCSLYIYDILIIGPPTQVQKYITTKVKVLYFFSGNIKEFVGC